MKPLRIFFVVIALVLVCGQLFHIQQDGDFSWQANWGSYLSIIGGGYMMAAMVASEWHERRKARKPKND